MNIPRALPPSPPEKGLLNNEAAVVVKTVFAALQT